MEAIGAELEVMKRVPIAAGHIDAIRAIGRERSYGASDIMARRVLAGGEMAQLVDALAGAISAGRREPRRCHVASAPREAEEPQPETECPCRAGVARRKQGCGVDEPAGHDPPAAVPRPPRWQRPHRARRAHAKCGFFSWTTSLPCFAF